MFDKTQTQRNTQYAIRNTNIHQGAPELDNIIIFAHTATTLTTRCRRKNFFMQNKPNFKKHEIKLTPYTTKAYEEKHPSHARQNEPNSNPNKANSNPKQGQNKPNQTQYGRFRHPAAAGRISANITTPFDTDLRGLGGFKLLSGRVDLEGAVCSGPPQKVSSCELI